MRTSKRVREQPYESVVMDLDLDDEGEEDASSMNPLPYYLKDGVADYYYNFIEYEDEDEDIKEEGDSLDTGVATRANINVDDASYMSSDVDYYYSEEDEGYSHSEEDEDDSFDSAESEKRKEALEKSREVLDSLWQAYLDRNGIKEEDMKRPVVIRPQLKDWVDSWKVNDHHHDQRHFVWVNVYAYYSKDKHYGGYGVILRDPVAKPIAASSNFTASGVSFYTQVLMGIKAGVALADKHGLCKLRVVCNSIKVPILFRNCHRCKSRTADDSRICRGCRQYYSKSEGSSLSLVPHLREINVKTHGGELLEDLKGLGLRLNRAAYHLAKMGKGNRHKVGDEEIKPDDFPEELKSILWEDAFDLEYYNESWLIDMATRRKNKNMATKV